LSLYKEHAKFNIFLALPILLIGGIYFLHPPRPFLLTFASAFVYSTLFMNPDLDLARQIRLFSLRGFLTLPFRSYSSVFRHRGLSHHPLLGSLTRILWLLGWYVVIFYLVYKAVPTKASFLGFYEQYKPFIHYGFAGICLSDWCHLFLDLKD
jgi:uncharacterized metal-binding protein